MTWTPSSVELKRKGRRMKVEPLKRRQRAGRRDFGIASSDGSDSDLPLRVLRLRGTQVGVAAASSEPSRGTQPKRRHATSDNGRQRHDMHGHTCARQKYEAMHASIEAVLYTPAVTPVPGLLHNQIKLQYRTMPSSHQQRRLPSAAASGGLAASPFAAAAARVVGPFLATAGTAAAPAACKALPRAPARASLSLGRCRDTPSQVVSRLLPWHKYWLLALSLRSCCRTVSSMFERWVQAPLRLPP